MMPHAVRAFVAIRLAGEVERAVAEFADSLRPIAGSAVRWVRRANLHLTLRFLGDRVDASTLERLDHALARLAATTVPFTITVRGAGAFPNLAHPRVLWAGLESTGLITLADRVERAAVESGLAPEARPYAPHLTIGRVNRLHGWDELRPAIEAAAAREFGASPATAMILYRSMLAVDAATYEELARYSFGSGVKA